MNSALPEASPNGFKPEDMKTIQVRVSDEVKARAEIELIAPV
jgi:hypothetical protein